MSLHFSFRFFALLLFLTLIPGCTTPDEQDESEEPEAGEMFPEVVVIARQEQVVQIDVSPSGSVEAINLTEEFDVPFDYHYFQAKGDYFSFFSRGPGGFKVWQKNFRTGETLFREEICELNGEEIPFYPLSAGNSLVQVTGTIGDPYYNNFLNIYDRAIGNCTRVFVGNGDLYPYEAGVLAHENAVFVNYKKGTEWILARIDPEKGKVEAEMTLESPFRATVQQNRLYVFLQGGNYKVYATEDFSQTGEGFFNAAPFSSMPGFFETQISDSRMLLDISYAQPGPVAKGPLVVDIEENVISEGADSFLLQVIQNLNRRGVHVKINTYEVDLENNLVICGYQLNDGSWNKGGLIYTNFDAEILEVVEFDYVPKHILLK